LNFNLVNPFVRAPGATQPPPQYVPFYAQPGNAPPPAAIQKPPTPAKPDPPLKKTNEEYERATFKLWRVYSVIKFMKMKEDLCKVQLKSKIDFAKSYFQEDIPAIKEQCFLMLKSRYEPLVTDVVKLFILDY
jgi:hypothetical protein